MNKRIKVEYVVLELTDSELDLRGTPFGVAYNVYEQDSVPYLLFAFLHTAGSPVDDSRQRFREDLLGLTQSTVSDPGDLFLDLCGLSTGPARTGEISLCFADEVALRMNSIFHGLGIWPQDFLDVTGEPLGLNPKLMTLLTQQL